MPIVQPGDESMAAARVISTEAEPRPFAQPSVESATVVWDNAYLGLTMVIKRRSYWHTGVASRLNSPEEPL